MSKKTNTKDKILKASLQCFLTVGIDQTSLNQIAEKIGIKKPSIYYHFKSKEEIIKICVDNLLDDLEHRIDLSITDHTQPREQIEAIYECIIDFHSGLSLLVYDNSSYTVNLSSFFQRSMLEHSSINDRIQNYYHSLQVKLILILSNGQKMGVIKNNLNKEIVSIDLISRIEGMISLSSLYSNSHINLQRQGLYETVWDSLKSEQQPKKKRILDYKSIDLGRKW